LKWQGKIDYLVQNPKSTVFIGFNNKSERFKEKVIRKNFKKALELEKMVFNLNRGNAILATGPLPPIYNINLNNESVSIDSDSYPQQEYENEHKPVKINFTFPKVAFSRRTILEYLKSIFVKMGVRLIVYEYDSWKEHDAAIKSDSAELFIDTYSAEVLGDPANFLYSLFHSQSNKNTLHYHNTMVDQLIDQAILERDIEVRRNIYKNILHLISQDTPAIFLSHVKLHFAYRTAKIKKLVVNKYGIIQFHQSILN
jgi:peptide/nickel transport system substrate-binding protein